MNTITIHTAPHYTDASGNTLCWLERHTAYAYKVKYFYNYDICMNHQRDLHFENPADMLTFINEERLSEGLPKLTEDYEQSYLEALFLRAYNPDSKLYSLVTFLGVE